MCILLPKFPYDYDEKMIEEGKTEDEITKSHPIIAFYKIYTKALLEAKDYPSKDKKSKERRFVRGADVLFYILENSPVEANPKLQHKRKLNKDATSYAEFIGVSIKEIEEKFDINNHQRTYFLGMLEALQSVNTIEIGRTINYVISNIGIQLIDYLYYQNEILSEYEEIEDYL